MERLQEKVMEHDFAIKSMAESMKELAETTKDSNRKLGSIATSMTKQEVILEKLANLESTSKDSVNRIHKRIDGLEKIVEEYVSRGENKGCTALQLLKEQEHTIDVRLEANIKSNQKRLDKLDSTVIWIARTIIGTLVTGVIGLLFYVVKG